MNALNRLQFRLMLDDLSDNLNNTWQSIKSLFHKHRSTVGVYLYETNEESEGRVWVEAGKSGLRLRVIHLHPANPAVSETLHRKCLERVHAEKENNKESQYLTGNLIYPPEDDQISLSSLEDYWFNHWQGPVISADTNQNEKNSRCFSSHFRRSHRRSKRGNRCSVCHKKMVKTEKEEECEIPFVEQLDVVAHMPSIKLDTISFKEPQLKIRVESPARTSSSRSSENGDYTKHEENHSKSADDCLNISEEQINRMHRVVDNEIRTSYSLFAQEVVSEDVVDTTLNIDKIGSNIDLLKEVKGKKSSTFARSTRFLMSPIIPRQSRSCPCSPKVSTRKKSQDNLTINSSKSRHSTSFVGGSKFSLSTSLLAIHRHASCHSLLPEFLKIDASKSRVSNSDTLKDSFRSSTRKSRSSLGGVSHQSSFKEGSQVSYEESEPDESANRSKKNLIVESHSLPSLKFAKMSLNRPFRISEKSSSLEKLSKNECENVCSIPDDFTYDKKAKLLDYDKFQNTPGNSRNSDTKFQNISEESRKSQSFKTENENPKTLPDVVPKYDPLNTKQDSFSKPSTSKATNSFSNDTKDLHGVVNLGFDGNEESSDSVEEIFHAKDSTHLSVNARTTSFLRTQTLAEGINSTCDPTLLSPERGKNSLSTSDIDSRTQFSIYSNENPFPSGSVNSCSQLNSERELNLIVNRVNNLPEFQNNSNSAESRNCKANLCEKKTNFGTFISNQSIADSCGTMTSPPATLPIGEQGHDGAGGHHGAGTFIIKDTLEEARDQVFWWRRKNVSIDESEFCLHHNECRVKQKPLILFLHGIGSSGDVWTQQLWYFLSCGYEVVAPDLLGHGLSSAPKSKKSYSFDQMLDYVSLVMDLFVPVGRKCIVIGHNYGSALAVALARGRPSNVSLLVLLSCGGPNPLVPYARDDTGLSICTKYLLAPFIACGCLSREHLYAPRGKHFPPVTSDSAPPSTPGYVLECLKIGQKWPEGDMSFHRRITIPVLLLHGMKDESISFVDMCEMEKTIPRAFLEMIPGACHEMMTESPEEVCHAIHRFIRRWKNYV